MTTREKILDLVSQYYQENFSGSSAFVPGESRVNYGGRVFDEKEMLNLVDSALDFWLTAGPWAERLEKDLAAYLGVKFASLCNSGSSANLLAFMALTAPELGDRRIRRGDEVITVAAGFPTTVFPIIQYGAVPVFVDVALEDCNIDPELLEGALSDRTKAVMAAHTLGNPFDLARVQAFCRKHNLWLIEDNCDALGSTFTIDGVTRQTGSWGDLGTSSFYPPHHMTTGEGGAVYTSDPLLHKLVNSFRDWGRDCWCPSGRDDTCRCRFTRQYGTLPPGYDHKYVYSHLGYNLKLTDPQAAIGVAQLEKMPSFVEARRKNWQYLYDKLHDLPGLMTVKEHPDARASWFGFVLSVAPDAGFTRNDLTSYLESRNIQTRNLFAGNLLRHPVFLNDPESIRYRVAGSLENTDFIMNNTFWIGVYPGMTPEKLDFMAAEIANFAAERSK